MPKLDSTKELSAPDALVLIRDILEYGEVEEKQFDQVRGNWKYRIKGDDIEGESGRVVTAIVSRDTQIIVTAF